MARKKIGKNRLDKFYHLAKEQGYRARSAYKLIHLDEKYHFLRNVDTIIDLCAAPGGWLQVAAQKNINFIVGVDLDIIKPINNVKTFVGDITTDTCRKDLTAILNGRKADLVVHDGAPNVGTSWERDAFMQNELVLHSLKLASEFLKDNGNFLTKVFRSKDYSVLLNVFNQLFKEVDATKPISSRDESAEIFVFCKGFKIKNVKQELFDPNKVFDDQETKTVLNARKVMTIQDFIEYPTPKLILEEYDRIIVKDFDLEEEYIEYFKDLKLLSEYEKKKILRWRIKFLKTRKKVRSFNIEDDRNIDEEINLEDFKERVCQNENDRNIEERENVDEEDNLKDFNERVCQNENDRNIEERENVDKEVNLEDFKESVCQNENDRNIEKLQKIEDELKKLEKKNNKKIKREKVKIERKNMKKEQKIVLPQSNFFNDKLFDTLQQPKLETIKQEIDKPDDYSCSDSIDLDDEELKVAVMLKEKEEELILDSIDKYCTNDISKLPNHIKQDFEDQKRPAKINKREEAINRRKKRALKCAEKVLVTKEDDSEEEDVARKIRRCSYKKTRAKPRIVFAKGKNAKIPRGKGRVVFLDRRMKKDRRKK